MIGPKKVGTIFLWEAGQASGATASREGALAEAGGHLTVDTAAMVEEADVVLKPTGDAGLDSEYLRTGRAWHGCLRRGSPSWEQAGPERKP